MLRLWSETIAGVLGSWTHISLPSLSAQASGRLNSRSSASSRRWLWCSPWLSTSTAQPSSPYRRICSACRWLPSSLRSPSSPSAPRSSPPQSQYCPAQSLPCSFMASLLSLAASAQFTQLISVFPLQRGGLHFWLLPGGPFAVGRFVTRARGPGAHWPYSRSLQ